MPGQIHNLVTYSLITDLDNNIAIFKQFYFAACVLVTLGVASAPVLKHFQRYPSLLLGVPLTVC